MSIEVAKPTWREGRSADMLADLRGRSLPRLAALAVVMRVSGLAPAVTYAELPSAAGLTTRKLELPDKQHLRAFARVNAGGGDASTIFGAALSFADNGFDTVVHGSGGDHHDADELKTWQDALEIRPAGRHEPEVPGAHTVKDYLLDEGSPWTLFIDWPNRHGSVRPVAVTGETADRLRLYDPSTPTTNRHAVRYVLKQALGGVAAHAGFSIMAVRRHESSTRGLEWSEPAPLAPSMR